MKIPHVHAPAPRLSSASSSSPFRTHAFIGECAASSGGGLVHAGVLEEVSNTIFEGNGAGNEGPAILSLGLLRSMTGVTFEGNEFYCEAGKFSTEDVTVRAEKVRER